MEGAGPREEQESHFLHPKERAHERTGTYKKQLATRRESLRVIVLHVYERNTWRSLTTC